MKKNLLKRMVTRLTGLSVAFFMMVAVQGMAQKNNSSGGSSATFKQIKLPELATDYHPATSSTKVNPFTKTTSGNIIQVAHGGNTTNYQSWNDAVEALQENDVITLLQDVELVYGDELGKPAFKIPKVSCTIQGTATTTVFKSTSTIEMEAPVTFKNLTLDLKELVACGNALVFDENVTCTNQYMTVCGGSGFYEEGVEIKSTSITIKSGTFQTVYGGGFYADVTGDTNIKVLGGNVSWLYGGGKNASVAGTANVEIENGSIDYVYGGGKESYAECGNTNVTIKGGTFGKVDGYRYNLMGGGEEAPVTGKAKVTINGGTFNCFVTAGGGQNNATTATCGSTELNITGGTFTKWTYGGGWASPVLGTATVRVSGSASLTTTLCGGGVMATASCQNTDVQVSSGSLGYLYGGGENGPVIGESKLTIDGSASASWTFGGCYDADCGSTEVTLNTTGTIAGGLYGGCRTGSSNTSRVNIKQGTVTDLIYGGGEQEASVVTGDTYVTMDGGSCIGVYGGGWQGQVNGTTHVLVNGGTISNAIYGGGYGSDQDQDNDKGRVGNTEVKVTGVTTKSTVFGDGLYGSVTSNTSVIIEGGKFDGIYGSGLNGQIGGKADILVKGGEISVLRIASNNIPEVGGSITIEGNPTITSTINSCQNITGDRADDFKLILKGGGTKENPLVLPTIDRFTNITLDNSFITIESVNPSSTEYPAIRLLSGKATTIKGKGLTGETLLVRSVGGVPSTSVPLIIGDFPSNLQFSYFYSADTKYPLFKAGDTYQLSEYKDAVTVVLKTVNITQPTHGALAVKWIGVAGNHDTELDSGDRVPANTELTLSVIPKDGYQGGSVFANGVELTGSTHSVTDDVTFSAQGFTAIPYTVSVTPTANGTITATPNTNVTVGTEVALTILPNDGYRLKSGSLKVYKTGDGGTTIALSGTSFNMPTYGVTVTAEFEQIPYQITISSMENGNITASPSVDITEGVEVALTVSPADGYRLKSGSLQVYKTGDANTTVALSGNSFRMPAYDVTVMAEFEGIPAPPPPVYYTVTLPSVEGATTDPAPGDYEVESWENFRFYLTLDEDYNQSEPIVTTDRGETITPRSSDGAYIVKYIRSDVEIFIDGVVKNPDPVANETVDTGGIKIYTVNGYLHIQAPQPEQVHIFTPDGRLLKAFRTSGNEEQIALPKGIYLIRVTNQCVKVVL